MPLTSDQLIAFIKDTLQIESGIDANSKLFSTGELDSMSMMQLIDFIESTSRVDIRPDDVTLENFDSIESILRFISEKV